MKRKLVLLLAILMCIFLCACGGSVKTQQLKKAEEDLLSQLTEEQSRNDMDNVYKPSIKQEESGKEIVISKEELATYSEYIELTKENWSDYFEIIEEEYIVTDAFGEETERGTHTLLALKDNCYISRDNAIRLTYMRDSDNRITTEDFVFRDRRYSIWLNMEYEIICEKIKGTILRLTIPNEKWNVDEDGEKYLRLDVYSLIDDFSKIDNKSTAIYESFID